MSTSPDKLTVGLVQIAPEWLDRDATLDRVISELDAAAKKGCDLVAFGEALVPGYPFWIERTGGATFNQKLQKEMFSIYLDQSVDIPRGDLEGVSSKCREHSLAVYLGIIEKGSERGGHSVYASLVYIDKSGEVQSVHRKLMPTYDERLVWSVGDGHGLRVHKLGAFTVGGLNCWENWMPLPRTSLYGQGEDLHVAVWPGGVPLTKDITRFIAKESRSYCVSVGGLMRREDIPEDLPCSAEMLALNQPLLANGGSCLAGPDGEWIIEPCSGEEALLVAEVDHAMVREERHNFDVVGHYSRPDVLQLSVNRERQNNIRIVE